MPPAVLGRCLLDGLNPEDWYDLLNSKVFFWLDPDRLNRQRRACGDAPQRVLVVDASRMLEKHGGRATVTPINTGNAMRSAAPRGLSTFVPWVRWMSDGWEFEKAGRTISRPANHKPVELTIEDAVEDIMDHVTGMILLDANRMFGAGGHVVDDI
jgi:hypothetical protein